MSALADTKTLLEELISFPTVSSDSNLDMILHLAERLSNCGAEVDIWHDETGTKANLFATLGPKRDGGIVLSGHSDVVPVTDQDWSSDPFVMDTRDGKWFGRGACDMKGFIAAAVAMAPRYATLDLQRPVHFAFTYDEEVGCFGARALADTLRERGIKPAVAIIGEPTSMRIIEGHKGCYEYTTHFTGLEGHGSGPDRGVNAVEYAVRYVSKLLELKADLQVRAPESSRFEPPWTTINTGALVGGVAHNVIPGKARVEWEMRPVQQSDADFVKGELHQFCTHTLIPAMKAVHPDAGIETEVIGEVDGLEPMAENEARDLVMELTGANGADVVPFGTEAGIFQGLGMSVVVCGPGSIDQAHKPDEYVSADQMEQCLDMLTRLSAKLV
ncbi:acetylornithine deacetylase [Aliiroseovarius crassostreae]|uniref:acetylornithine deacetylase n=1 Tax=Aliiroseovarius crassostreae TaxID=154981 RepID=UPI0021AF1D90|nr:acetylornithine deacetylase [Aliiroseovarius crassostreae]UWP92014.1 acetylornithine deacetylase [Aliiroseovarius crassostreae]